MKNTIAAVGILLLMLFPFQRTLAEEDCDGVDELRIYSGHIARWLGVDPQADKYPDVSPYAYCEDNPQMYVDPDGEDVWELNEEGRVLRHIHDDSKDAFRMNGKEIAFDYGTVVSVNEEDQSTECRFYDSDAAISTFKFFRIIHLRQNQK